MYKYHLEIGYNWELHVRNVFIMQIERVMYAKCIFTVQTSNISVDFSIVWSQQTN